MEESCYPGDEGGFHTCWARILTESWMVAGTVGRALACWASGALGPSVSTAIAFVIY